MATVTGGDKVGPKLAEFATLLSNASSVRVGFLEGATYPDGTPVALVAAILTIEPQAAALLVVAALVAAFAAFAAGGPTYSSCVNQAALAVFLCAIVMYALALFGFPFTRTALWCFFGVLLAFAGIVPGDDCWSISYARSLRHFFGVLVAFAAIVPGDDWPDAYARNLRHFLILFASFVTCYAAVLQAYVISPLAVILLTLIVWPSACAVYPTRSRVGRDGLAPASFAGRVWRLAASNSIGAALLEAAEVAIATISLPLINAATVATGADLDEITRGALRNAAIIGSERLASAVLNGAAPETNERMNEGDRHGESAMSPLELACISGSTGIVRELLRHSAEVRHRGRAAFKKAVAHGNPDIVALLLTDPQSTFLTGA